VIAGDGPRREAIRARFASLTSLHAIFTGHLSWAEMTRLYAAADAFALPSLKDPNPLVAVEALWAGLPLLLSNRVGNHPEVLTPGINGWLFDPLSPSSVASAIRGWLSTPIGDLPSSYGAISRAKAEQAFRSRAVADGFTRQLREPDDALPLSGACLPLSNPNR
jgi:glycosyltransferase involved in cell wall biosynthesis